ncbi:MAG: hypothetical protein U1F16_18570 [Turneriella sp.]
MARKFSFMLFEKIPHRMALSAFRQNFPERKVTEPKPGDYDESLWAEMKLKFFATFTENTDAGEILYQLTFSKEILSFLQLSITGDFQETAYSNLAALAQQTIAAGNTRGIGSPAETSALLSWKELIQSPLPDSGRPDERYITILTATWKLPDYSAYLKYDWTWPGQLNVEYREEAR